ncbi:hypothetical protein [Lentilactobacillus kefiri]|nr:hypothetical protein [Lentilactobacillus kefiri]MDH5109469.1 hypothetical protein [Lentilactobacillus kefiri]
MTENEIRKQAKQHLFKAYINGMIDVADLGYMLGQVDYHFIWW